MLRIIMSLLVAVVAWSSPASANGTREDAMAMVKRVQEMFRKQGTEATFRAVTDNQWLSSTTASSIHSSTT